MLLALVAGRAAWAGGQGSDTTTKGSVLEDDWNDDDDAGPPVKRPPPKKPEQKPADQKPAPQKPAPDAEEGGGNSVFDDDDDLPPPPKNKKAPKTIGPAPKGPAAGDQKGERGDQGEAAEATDEKLQLRMKYRGVAPGQTELPPNVPKKPVAGQGPRQMTWPGFQVKNGQATVFFQLSGPVEYSVGEESGAVTLTLHDTVVSARNNLRPLLVGEFNTPVKSVQIDSQRKKKLVRVSVMVKGQVAHRERLEQDDNGYSMLIMEVMPMHPAEDKAQAQQQPSATPGSADKAQAQVQRPPAPPKPHDPFEDDD